MIMGGFTRGSVGLTNQVKVTKYQEQPQEREVAHASLAHQVQAMLSIPVKRG